MISSHEWLREQKPANIPAKVLVADHAVIIAIQVDALRHAEDVARKYSDVIADAILREINLLI